VVLVLVFKEPEVDPLVLLLMVELPLTEPLPLVELPPVLVPEVPELDGLELIDPLPLTPDGVVGVVWIEPLPVAEPAGV